MGATEDCMRDWKNEIALGGATECLHKLLRSRSNKVPLNTLAWKGKMS